ncbi:MAG: response regulator [Deltaproteobacteria bacterium]|nr:response regulator [Deltaproteobacteria bacterium]
MNKRIVVIDDEESALTTYRMILSPPQKEHSALIEKERLEAELFGDTASPKRHTPEIYEVVSALQGKEGFDLINAAVANGRPFAVAFVDVRMPPGWDGVETCRMIRRVDPNIEIVIVTAYSDKERREIVEKVGMPERLLYLKKPFDPDEIRQLALSLTRKWNLERAAERHRDYLASLLDSIRRLRTLNLSSLKEVLGVILNEVLHFVDAQKGVIAKRTGDEIQVEIATADLPDSELASLTSLLSSRSLPGDSITWIDQVMVIPLKDLAGNMHILVLDIMPPVSEDKEKLLKLLLETSSEVLAGFQRHEQFLKNDRIAAIGQIAAGLIHEINNPLSAIVSAVDMFGRMGERLWRLVTGYGNILKGPGFPPEYLKQFDDLNNFSRTGQDPEKDGQGSRRLPKRDGTGSDIDAKYS